jgi:DNA-binding MarR family transcriptional regulator
MRDTLKGNLGYAFTRASAAMLARLNRQLAAHGLRHVDATILVLVGDNPGVSQSDLCRTLDIASANMVPLIARLVDRGLIDRNKADGRSFGLTLTTHGNELAAAAHAEMAVHEEWLTKILGKGERALVSNFLARVGAEPLVSGLG